MDYILIALILFAYWECMGVLIYAWTYVRAWVGRYNIQSDPFVRSGEYFKVCLIFGPLMLVIVAIAEVKGFILWWRKEKQ